MTYEGVLAKCRQNLKKSIEVSGFEPVSQYRSIVGQNFEINFVGYQCLDARKAFPSRILL
jgi:hypothetical protein